jgi:hypothetical protein
MNNIQRVVLEKFEAAQAGKSAKQKGLAHGTPEYRSFITQAVQKAMPGYEAMGEMEIRQYFEIALSEVRNLPR